MVQIVTVVESIYGTGNFGSSTYGENIGRVLMNTADVVFNDLNTITVEFEIPTSGEVIIIG